MPTVAQIIQRQTVAEVNVRRAEDYERFEQSMLLDELTDQSERLARPMENGFIYSLRADGKLYSEHEDRLEDVFRTGLRTAEIAAARDPHNWEFERERRAIECEEIQEIQQLDDGEKLIVFTPIPDKVRAGLTNINGYDRKRQKMLVRIAERQNNEVAIFSFSLDGSDYPAMQAAALAVGADIPDGLSSEEILARRFRYGADHDFTAKDCHLLIRDAYDLALERQYGGKRYAGRQELDMGDALSFIRQQTDLVGQHMRALQDINARTIEKEHKQQLLEMARYDLAAALDDRLAGRAVADISSAGSTARAEGREYSGDCPTESTVQLGYSQGRNVEMKCVICPFCKETVDAVVSNDSIACPRESCGVSVSKKTGKVSKKTAQESMWEVVGRWIEEGQRRREYEKRTAQSKRLGKSAYALAG